MTKQESAKLVAIIASFHPRIYEGGEVTINAWHFVLGDIDYISVQEAILYCLNNSKFPPTPADVRDYLYHKKNKHIKSAGEAWQEVLENLNPYKIKPWSNELIEKAVRSVGYMSICMSECIGVERSHFIKNYENLLSRLKEQDVSKAVLQIIHDKKLIGVGKGL